ncbi:MAG: DUF6273 domain-containing protein [Lachnospiraceae bacterium]|jgi:hypothetical protein|nr:DUF6273 domain-containing protein [Lachnospiraceae bacterium]
MKKKNLAVYFGVLLMLLALTACKSAANEGETLTVAAATPAPTLSEAKTPEPTANEAETPAPAPLPQIGEVIEFGGIDWRVLDVQGSRALLISKDVLEYRCIHPQCANEVVEDEGRRYVPEKSTGITWAKSAMRSYLNGEFLSRFSADERARIVLTEIQTPFHNNAELYADVDINTEDYIFLLSIEEVERYMPSNIDRIACFVECDYDHVGDLETSQPGRGDDGLEPSSIRPFTCQWETSWWLRTTGMGCCTASVSINGYINDWGYHDYLNLGMRPALWLRFGE